MCECWRGVDRCRGSLCEWERVGVHASVWVHAEAAAQKDSRVATHVPAQGEFKLGRATVCKCLHTTHNYTFLTCAVSCCAVLCHISIPSTPTTHNLHPITRQATVCPRRPLCNVPHRQLAARADVWRCGYQWHGGPDWLLHTTATRH